MPKAQGVLQLCKIQTQSSQTYSLVSLFCLNSLTLVIGWKELPSPGQVYPSQDSAFPGQTQLTRAGRHLPYARSSPSILGWTSCRPPRSPGIKIELQTAEIYSPGGWTLWHSILLQSLPPPNPTITVAILQVVAGDLLQVVQLIFRLQSLVHLEKSDSFESNNSKFI